MSTDESAWTRHGSETMVGPITPAARILPPAAAVVVEGDPDDRTPGALAVVTSAPALALAAFAFAVAQLLGGLVPSQLASMIPSAADSPANHVRIVSLFDLGMAGVGIALAAAALVRARERQTASADHVTWAGWLAGGAVVICALVAFQSVLLIILSALAPPGASS
jgi:hypothetical protein